MAGVLVDTGELLILNGIVSLLFNVNTRLKLFVNNHIPVGNDTVLDYVEATYPGYAGINLNSWSAAYLNGANEAQTDETIRTITSTGSSAESVYGYFVTNIAGSTLYWAELNPSGPVAITSSGIPYSVQPKFIFRNAVPVA